MRWVTVSLTETEARRMTYTIYWADVDPEDEPTFASRVACTLGYLRPHRTLGPLHTCDCDSSRPLFQTPKKQWLSSAFSRVIRTWRRRVAALVVELWHKWNYEHTCYRYTHADTFCAGSVAILSRALPRLSITDVIIK